MKTIISSATIVLLLMQCEAQFQSTLTRLTEETLSEDGKLNFTQLTRKYGHESEKHEVITEDGYILTMFHTRGDKPPILLLHGLLDSADSYAMRGNNSLVITLADAGYDVWTGNCRGNKLARRHVKLDPDKDVKFWDFSWHEMGYYDVPAMIDYIREKTGENSVSVIGHSQGTTVFWVLGALRPEYNSKIKVFIALGPGAFYRHVRSPFSLLMDSLPFLDAMLPQHSQEILKDNQMVSRLARFVCSRGTISYHLCAIGIMFPLVGADSSGLEPDFLKTAIGHLPAGTSRRAVMHYNQVYFRRKFAQYDFGHSKNLAKYGSPEPPEYDLSAITAKVALIVGKNDPITTVEDTELLKDSLPNVVLYKVLKPKYWNHVDYVCGAGMAKYLYPTIFELLEKYNVKSEDRSISQENNLPVIGSSDLDRCGS